MPNELRYFSTFTGVGGFELGIGDRAKCVGFSEIDRYASQLLSQRFPETRNYGDITKIAPDTIPDFDLFVGGFPCQAFSIAGKRRGFEDTRGTMFFEVARILKVKRPKFVLLENVKGLLNHDKGQTFSVILQTLEELGYRTQWMVLNSKFFGVPQNRERVFIIGSLRGESRPEILPFGEITGEDSSINQVNNPKHSYYRAYSTDSIAPCFRSSNGNKVCKIAIPVLTPDREEKRQNGRRFKEDGEESFTLTKTDIHGVAVLSHSPRTNDPTKGGSGPLISNEHSFTLDSVPHKVINGLKIRRLTPTECERLQGFPDGWTQGFSDTQRYKMMGNAVTVNVIKAIIDRWFNEMDTKQ